MSPLFANLLVLAVFAAALVPLAVAFRGPRSAVVVATGTIALILCVAGAHLWLTDGLAPTETADLGLAKTSAARCEGVLRELDRARLVLDRSNPARPVVASQLWDQLPATVRDAIMDCFEAASGGDPVEVVKR